MNDFAKYIDKHPLRYYSLGPSGQGVKNTQAFSTEWVGWFEPGQGFNYVPSTGYLKVKPILTEYSQNPNAQTFSFTFESGSNPYFALGNLGQISVRFVSGVSTTDFLFSGYNPMLFNNSVLTRGANETYCFYTRTYEQLYYKKASENFSVERLAFTGTQNIKWFTQVANVQPYTYRYLVFGMTNDGDGFSLLSKKHPSIETGFLQSFQSLLTGNINSYPPIGAEVYSPSGHIVGYGYNKYLWMNSCNFQDGGISGRIISYDYLYSDDFQNYEVAPIGTFDSTNGMFGGRIRSRDFFNNVNFQNYLVGPLNQYLVGNDVYNGYFFYGSDN